MEGTAQTESQAEMVANMQKTLQSIRDRKTAIEKEISELEDNKARQKKRTEYVKVKAKDVLKSDGNLCEFNQTKSKALTHLVQSMDLINKLEGTAEENLSVEIKARIARN